METTHWLRAPAAAPNEAAGCTAEARQAQLTKWSPGSTDRSCPVSKTRIRASRSSNFTSCLPQLNTACRYFSDQDLFEPLIAAERHHFLQCRPDRLLWDPSFPDTGRI